MSTEGTPVRAGSEGRPVDRNGFYLSQAQIDAGVDAAGEPLVLSKQQMEVFRRRERKWQEMLKNWDAWMPKKRDKVKERCRKGIPNTLRGWSWRVLCGADKLEVQNPGRFDELAAEADDPAHATGKMSEYLEIIERDLDRTFPHNERFSQVGGEGQLELRNVLRALAMANKDLGYCQGMGMIAGTLMMQMPTEQAFWCMVAMQDPALGYLHGFFDAGLGEIQICGMVLHWLMATHLPAVHAKFVKEQMEPVLYMVDWFMCCFVKTLPWQSVLRVWDMFMFEGMKIVYRVALAILKLSEKELTNKKHTMGELMMYLKNLPDRILLPEVLMPAALGIKIKTKEIARLHKAAKKEYEKTHPPKRKEEESTAAPPAANVSAPQAPVIASAVPTDPPAPADPPSPAAAAESAADVHGADDDHAFEAPAEGGAGAATLWGSDDEDLDVDAQLDGAGAGGAASEGSDAAVSPAVGDAPNGGVDAANGVRTTDLDVEVDGFDDGTGLRKASGESHLIAVRDV